MHSQKEWDRAICVNPYDHQIRLVWADWLEENGEEERAELIRGHVELETTVISDSLREFELKCKVNHLLSPDFEHRYDTWPLKLNFMSFSSHTLLHYGDKIFSEQPLTQVYLKDKSPNPGYIINAAGIFVESNAERVWTCMGNPRPREEYFNLPVQFFIGLKRGRLVTTPNTNFIARYYPDTQTALEDLSQACVNWGRLLVNLPPLDFTASCQR